MRIHIRQFSCILFAMKIKMLALFSSLVIFSLSCGAPAAKEVSVQTDIVYCVADGIPLTMDMYRSAGTNNAPAILHVHGGAWVSGEKSNMNRIEIYALARAGFTIFSINYRLAPEHRFPAMIEDVKCAARSIRARADEYHIDARHIGAFGESAGGHLVSLLGVSDSSAGFDAGEYLEQSSRVQAVVDLYGPTDLESHPPRILENVFSNEQLKLASPLTHVSADDPPFLILHGKRDKTVPLEQSQIFYDALTASHVPAEFVIINHAGHGLAGLDGEEIEPTREEITQMIVDFFIAHLE
jgi:acetyl esterase/lipase